MTPASVLVTIVNYRTADLAIEALAALEPEVVSRGDTYVVVVDNGSGDRSVERIGDAIAARGFGAWSTVIAETNGGFAAGNNNGLRHYRRAFGTAGQEAPVPDFVWLLNPDTIPQPGAIAGLVDFMRANPGVGIAGGRCCWPDGRVRHSSFRFHSPRRDLMAAVGFGPFTRLLGGDPVSMGVSDIPVCADWVSGSSFMIRRDVIETIGPMDEGFFLYFEETEYCARAADAGFSCWSVPESRIIHIAGQSTGVTGTAGRANRRPLYWFESRGRLFLSRYGRASTHLANLAWILGFPIGKLIAAIRRRPRSEPPYFWWDFLRAAYGPNGIMYRTAELTDPARIGAPAARAASSR
ncbi:MAG TPA: glycosyltransferase family 2 protein [Sphingomonas sp.]|nr:glycosyltransferase family 2 protein [Sphingomonas sp.]